MAKTKTTGKGKSGRGKKAPVIKTHANGLGFSTERPGVLAFLVSQLLSAHASGGITKADLLAKCVKQFPERDSEKMAATLSMQLPTGMYTEKGYVVSVTPSGLGKLYSLSPKAKAAGDAWRADPSIGKPSR